MCVHVVGEEEGEKCTPRFFVSFLDTNNAGGGGTIDIDRGRLNLTDHLIGNGGAELLGQGHILLVLGIAQSSVGDGGAELLGLLAVLGVHNVVEIDEVVVQDAIGNGLVERAQGGQGDAPLTIAGSQRFGRAGLVLLEGSGRGASAATLGVIVDAARGQAVGGEAPSLGRGRPVLTRQCWKYCRSAAS